jgi:DNA repair exonuclease SbcCD ATPase subunit
MTEIEALHLACAFDMKIPAARRAEVQRLIAAIESGQAPPVAANEPTAKGAEWKDWISKGKPKAGELSANDLARQAEHETQLKLMKVDIEVAALARKVAIAELESIMEIQKRNPSAISDAELRKAKFQVERTELEIRRLQIMLEGLEKPVVPPGPISR